MCGIWALLKYKPELTQTILNSINNLKNRGPDSTTKHFTVLDFEKQIKNIKSKPRTLKSESELRFLYFIKIYKMN